MMEDRHIIQNLLLDLLLISSPAVGFVRYVFAFLISIHIIYFALCNVSFFIYNYYHSVILYVGYHGICPHLPLAFSILPAV